MKKKISLVLRGLAVSPNLLGYEYLKTAVELCIEDHGFINQITKRLYPRIAEIHQTTHTRAERAMRHAIDMSIYDAPLDAVKKYVYLPSHMVDGAMVSTPTNSEYIASIVEVLKFELEG